jgi:DNA-binding CsgD family transcriptional regulator
MGDSDFLGRWIDLAADLLSRPAGNDPMFDVCDELALCYDAREVATMDYSETRARIGAYHLDLDPRPYVPDVGNHPLAMYYRSTHDPRTRALEDAGRFSRDPRSRAIIRRLRDEDLTDCVFLPLPARPDMEHRWLGVASSDALGSAARDELERVRPLIRAIDAQTAVLADHLRPSQWDPQSAESAGLTTRELAILALIARGLTAVAIAYQLHISARTVSKHQQNIYRKLEVHDRLTAVINAQDLGILPAPASEALRSSVPTVEAELVLH